MANWNKAATQKLTDSQELIKKLDDDINTSMKRVQMQEDEAKATQAGIDEEDDDNTDAIHVHDYEKNGWDNKGRAVDKKENWREYEYNEEIREEIEKDMKERHMAYTEDLLQSGTVPFPYDSAAVRGVKAGVFVSVQDSGVRQEFDTGSVRDTEEGKGRFDLISMYALTRLAVHYENGAKKYGDDNWRKGQPLRRYLSSAVRHLAKWSLGMKDEDHLSAAAWNIFCIIDHEHAISLGKLPASLDNRYKD